MSMSITDIFVQILSTMKTDIRDYCNLETAHDGKCLVADDGSMLSIVKLNGSKDVIGGEMFLDRCNMLTKALRTFLDKRGHQLQIVFRRDLDATLTLEALADQQRQTAHRVGLLIDDLIDETVKKYSHYVYDEQCYLAFWSRPSLLDVNESKMSSQDNAAERKVHDMPAAPNAQNLLRTPGHLINKHKSFVSNVFELLDSARFGSSVEWLDLAPALRAVRASVYPDLVTEQWVPQMMQTGYAARWNANRPQDGSAVLPPPLPMQIMSASADIGGKDNPLTDPTCVRVGPRVYAPLWIAMPPQEPEIFNALFDDLNRAETTENGRIRALPYSLCITLTGDGLSGGSLNNALSSVLSFTSSANRNFNLAHRYLSELARDGECITRLRISAMTWAQSNPEGIRELGLRKSKLWRALEGWGKAGVQERTGNPMVTFAECSLGLSPQWKAPSCPAPLSEAVKFLPLTRPASPFKGGATINRSLDGKILTYQRFSSQQTTWISLYSGKPGSGKSVLMNNNNLEACLLPGASRLPYIGIADIGISSLGFILMVQDALGPARRHLAVYKRLQNVASDSLNPLDTPLGMRAPLARGRSFAMNFVTMLVTPPERRGMAYEGMTDFVGRVIDIAYEMVDDRIEKGRPIIYKHGYDERLDAAVQQLVSGGFEVNPQTTYWELTDKLFDSGMFYEAEIAQRYAVPTLNSLVEAAASEEIRSVYGNARSNDGRSLLEAFMIGIREAVSNFKVFSGVTQFDVGPARIISLDLQDVAGGQGDQARKQTSLMFMIAREAFMKKIAFSSEDLHHVNPHYRSYYERLVMELVDEDKIFCIDEYHKTGGHPVLQEQVMTDGREARKWKLEIILASQLMEDFGKLTAIATSLFILDSGTEEQRAWMRANIGLSPVEESALKAYVNGAGPHGATYLAKFRMKDGDFSQIFTATIGAKRLWALSTTAEDRKLRSMLYEAMPAPDARAMLAEAFPSGSCKGYVDDMKAQAAKEGHFVDDEAASSVIEELAKNLINHYLNRRRAA